MCMCVSACVAGIMCIETFVVICLLYANDEADSLTSSCSFYYRLCM